MIHLLLTLLAMFRRFIYPLKKIDERGLSRIATKNK